MTGNDPKELKEIIRATLVEPPDQLNRELVKLCEGLIMIEERGKAVRVINDKLPDKHRVALYCLGRWILSFLLDTPGLADVGREDIAEATGLEPKTISAHASVLDKERLISKTVRGTYKARIANMGNFLRMLNAKYVADSKRKED